MYILTVKFRVWDVLKLEEFNSWGTNMAGLKEGKFLCFKLCNGMFTSIIKQSSVRELVVSPKSTSPLCLLFPQLSYVPIGQGLINVPLVPEITATKYTKEPLNPLFDSLRIQIFTSPSEVDGSRCFTGASSLL